MTPKALAVCAAASVLSACTWLTPSHVIDVATIVACVLENYPALPIAQVVVKCGAQDEKQVIDIFNAHRMAEERDMRAGACLKDGGR